MDRMAILASRFESLMKQKKQSSLDEKWRNEEVEKIEDELLLLMGENGMKSLNLASGMNLHQKVQTFVSVAEGFSKEQLTLELANHSCTSDLVSRSFNLNSLSARLTEMKANQDLLPLSLQQMIRVTEKDRLGYRS